MPGESLGDRLQGPFFVFALALKAYGNYNSGMDTRLSENFTLSELTRTDTGLPNTPPPGALDNLERLACDVLEPIRALLGAPLIIHSGYRSRDVNAAVGGARASAHLEGRACDFHPANEQLIRSEFEKIMHSAIPFDRIILEYKRSRYWIHSEIARHGDVPRELCYIAVENGSGMSYREVRR